MKKMYLLDLWMNCYRLGSWGRRIGREEGWGGGEDGKKRERWVRKG